MALEGEHFGFMLLFRNEICWCHQVYHREGCRQKVKVKGAEAFRLTSKLSHLDTNEVMEKSARWYITGVHYNFRYYTSTRDIVLLYYNM